MWKDLDKRSTNVPSLSFRIWTGSHLLFGLLLGREALILEGLTALVAEESGNVTCSRRLVGGIRALASGFDALAGSDTGGFWTGRLALTLARREGTGRERGFTEGTLPGGVNDEMVDLLKEPVGP